MTQRIEIYDTTLRDGTQGEAINFSVADKCRIAEELDALGFDFIEGGWPGSNPRDAARARIGAAAGSLFMPISACRTLSTTDAGRRE